MAPATSAPYPSPEPEGSRFYVPAAPPRCRLALPVLGLDPPEGGALRFSIAARGEEALLALAQESSAGDAGAPGPWARSFVLRRSALRATTAGPHPARVVGLFAGATADGFTVGWVPSEPDSEGLLAVRLGRASESGWTVETLRVAHQLSLSEQGCHRGDCALAWTEAAELGEDAPRSAVARGVNEVSPLATRAGCEAWSAMPAGLVARCGDAWWWAPRGAEARRLEGRILDLFSGPEGTWLLRAEAPTEEECQGSSWRVVLESLGAMPQRILLATTDHRPRGARLRWLHGGLLATWMDAPGCSPRFRVVRAWRGGSLSVIASADEYEVATAGARVWFAVRREGHLRLLEAECEVGDAGALR